jgi:tetratricopeptide (TPR) repeat protein
MRYSIGLFFLIVLFGIGCQSKLKDKKDVEKNLSEKSDSLAILTSLIKQDSNNYKLFARRAGNFMLKGQIDPALRDLNKAISINPDNSDLFVLLGDIYFVIGKKDNCLASYKKAYDLDPNNDKPLIKLAETHLIMKEYKQAEKYIELAISQDVNNQKAYYLKGVDLMETGDTANALLNLKIAGNLDSTYYEAFMQIASIYNKLNDSLAIDYYKSALKAIPDDERAMLLLAISYQNNGNFNKALKMYQEVLEINPSNKIAYFNSGYIYMVVKMEFDSAIDKFQHAISIDPSYVDAVYNLGRIYEEQGDNAAARNNYKQALELKTNYKLAIEGLNRLDKYQDQK